MTTQTQKSEQSTFKAVEVYMQMNEALIRDVLELELRVQNIEEKLGIKRGTKIAVL